MCGSVAIDLIYISLRNIIDFLSTRHFSSPVLSSAPVHGTRKRPNQSFENLEKSPIGPVHKWSGYIRLFPCAESIC